MQTGEPISEEQAWQYLSWTIANVRLGVEHLEQDEHWRVMPGSPMSADDIRTEPYQVSHASRSLLGSAIDHLHAIGNLLEGAEVLHPMAQFTLARGAIESSSAAAWMLEPSSRQERLRRRLRLAVKDSADSYTASEPLGLPRNRTRQQQQDRFREIAEQADVPPSEIFNRPTSTEIVRAASESSRSNLHVLTAWRVCSGFAHGRIWATLSTLDRVAVVEDKESGVGLYRVTGNVARVAWAVGAGFDVLKHAADLYQRRAANYLHPPS